MGRAIAGAWMPQSQEGGQETRGTHTDPEIPFFFVPFSEVRARFHCSLLAGQSDLH